MTSLAGGAAASYSLGTLNRVIIDMADGYLLITTISRRLGVGRHRRPLGQPRHHRLEMTLFASRAGAGPHPNADRRTQERRAAVKCPGCDGPVPIVQRALV